MISLSMSTANLLQSTSSLYVCGGGGGGGRQARGQLGTAGCEVSNNDDLIVDVNSQLVAAHQQPGRAAGAGGKGGSKVDISGSGVSGIGGVTCTCANVLLKRLVWLVQVGASELEAEHPRTLD
jgi:hypothetical protein